VLDLRHGLDEPLDMGALEVPQAKAVGDDWHHTRPVQQALLVRLKAPDRIAEHAHFYFFYFFKSTIYYAVLDHSPRQTIQTKYSLRVYKCKIVRETAALTSPCRAVMSPARVKRRQENDKVHWALRRLPKPALAPNADRPQHAQSTPKDVPSRSRICV
jgi:hypothetical protein